MNKTHRTAQGAGIEPKCSRPRGAVTAPEFVEVSPLMRSCIFGFNTHVAELPSSATDVRGTGVSALGPCKTVPAAESTVRRAFFSQLPEELLRNASCNDTPADKARRLQAFPSEPPSEVLLEDAPCWAAGGRCGAQPGGFLPSDVLVRLAALGRDVKPAACRKGRQAARRLTAGLSAGYDSAPVGLARDLRDSDLVDGGAASFLSPAADDTQPVPVGLWPSDTPKDAHGACELKDGSEPDRNALHRALSLALDKLHEIVDGDARGPPGDVCLLTSPASPWHTTQESYENSLHLADMVLPLESSPSHKDSPGPCWSILMGASFSLPHGPNEAFHLLEDIVEPTPSGCACGEKQAAAGLEGNSAVRLPVDAGGVFAEVQMTLLAMLEDLHAATCCCAAASSTEPCGCCFGASFLLKNNRSNRSVSCVTTRNSGSGGRAGAVRDCIGELSLPVSSSGTRSPSPVPKRAVVPVGPESSPVARCPAPCGSGRNTGDPISGQSYLSDSLASTDNKAGTASCAASPIVPRSGPSSAASRADTKPAQDDVRLSSDGGARRFFSGPVGSSGDGGDRESLAASEVTSNTEPGAAAGAAAPGHSPIGSGARDGFRPALKGGDATPLCRNDDSEDSLHLLFRHHVAVVTCADRFAELLPYSHIFRECVGTYRMPTTLPSPARHMLVQELLMLRHDPDRLLSRNSFQWTEAPGALLCLAEPSTSIPKGGLAADALHPDRLQRGDETLGCMSPQSSCGARAEVLASARGERSAAAAADAAAGADGSARRALRALPQPLLDPTVLLCASGTEMAAQKSAVLRILRMLRSLAPSWAARDDNFGFHFKTAITATSLDSPELQSYRVVLQCLSPFDAREWSRDQLMEVLSDLDCIRLAHRRRRNLRASIARVQGFVEQPDGGAVGNIWHSLDGTAPSRQRWELTGHGGAYASDGIQLCQPGQVVRGARDTHSEEHVSNTASMTDSRCGAGAVPISVRTQSVGSSKEQHGFLQQVPPQLSPNGNGEKGVSRPTAIASARQGVPDGLSYTNSDGAPARMMTPDLQALTVGGGASLAPGTAAVAGSARRGQSPTGSSLGTRRNASGSDTCCSTGGKAGNSSPSDCPMRQQYAVRAAELPKIKGVFIGKKHTCWVAQWNDANGQPRQSCFNIKQHGFEKARRLAVQARQTLMGMSTSKSTNSSPTEAQRAAAQPVPPAAPATREAPMPTRLPDLLLMRDATTAIAEAFGSRSVQTPTAILPHAPVKAKLEGLAAASDGPGVQGGHNPAVAAAGGSIPSSLSPTQTKVAASGTVTARNSPRGAPQRATLRGLPAEFSAASVPPSPTAQKHVVGTLPTPGPSAASSGSSSKQQLLLQRQLQQQIEEQLQQLQQLQQQLLKQSPAAPHTPVGTASSLLPNVISHLPGASSYLGLVDGSSSAMALVNSLLGGQAAAPHRVPAVRDPVHTDAQEPLGNVTALRSPEGQQRQATLPGTLETASELQPSTQCLNTLRGVAGVSRTSDEGTGTLRALYGSAEAPEEDGTAASSKRKHRLLYVHKQGKRTLASLAREFPSVGGVTYNVKCACWEVAVKGRETAKVFSTRKFGGLEAAYGAAVLWKRKVERGEEGADDGDGPEGQEDDCEDLDAPEGLVGGPSSAAWEVGLEGDESSRKRAACSRPEAFTSSFGIAVRHQESVFRPSAHAAPASDGSNSQVQQLLPRASSL